MIVIPGFLTETSYIIRAGRQSAAVVIELKK